ncbi:hypothetical protein ACX0MV_07965 [Pseudomonas borbori]
MTPPDIQIKLLQTRSGQRWQVRMGRRALIFQEELAARSFAAQLYLRLGWLRQQAIADNEQDQPS